MRGVSGAEQCRSRARAALLLLGAVLCGGAAEAQNVWRRARSPSVASEERVLSAVERVLTGRADDHDVHAAHAAYVEFARGESFEDVRIEVSLVRMRLAARWVYDARLEKRMRETLKRPVPPAVRGRAWIDYGALAALRGDAGATGSRMNEALVWAWQGGERAEALLGRGYASMAQGRAREAAVDFAQAASVSDSLRISAAAMASLSLAEARSGRADDARRSARAALSLDRRRASTLEQDLFDEVARLPSYEAFAVEALLHEARAEVQREALEDEAERRARAAACESLRQYLLRAEPDGAPWAPQAKRKWLACSRAP